ncbi:hypothetical protein Q4Q39_07215 [Flavivirga amylovorans]|uniref:Uncharacterized protein n=1 Tax=Flavivirga amylovorans TaxID=870486 RepID=A0ABT8WZT6_9FLAO|nr:hypothetical protein [Flavivirga amylovorans]MDO5987181.1 hypothetical protein [Flavivirga amylovorans]
MIIESTENDYISGNGLSCKHDDELISEHGNHQIKSCSKSKIINLPEGYELLSLLGVEKNLKPDFVYVSHKKKIGVYSILSEKIIIEPIYNDLEKIEDTDYFLSTNGKHVGLEYLGKDYNGTIEHLMISSPKFSNIEKFKTAYSIFLVSLPKNISGYMKSGKDKVVYLPKKIRSKYNLDE